MTKKLIIVADDLTGALDTGVPFVNNGLSVRVELLPQAEGRCGEACDVLILCTRSRHLPASQALNLVRSAFACAQSNHFSCYFKKIDSTLRGNLGAELEGMALALNPRRIHVLNAFPAAGRTTIGGAQYIHGIPLIQTPFAEDPFNPIQSSNILNIIQSQSELFRAQPERLQIHDARTDDDIMQIIRQLDKRSELQALAGCAGLANGLAQLWQRAPVKCASCRTQTRPIILCGSINPAALAQVDYARSRGVHVETLPASFLEGDARQHLADAQQLLERHKQQALIVQTPHLHSQHAIDFSHGVQMAQAMGRLYAALLQTGFNGFMLVIGGDTLEACVDAVHCHTLVPKGEPLPGTVLFKPVIRGSTHCLLSRAGGFGDDSALVDLLALMKGGIF